MIDAGMVRKVNRLDFTGGVGLPISQHENPAAFRIFPADVGILCALADVRHIPALTDLSGPADSASPDDPAPGMLDALVRTALLRSLTPQFGELGYWSLAKPRIVVAFVAELKDVVLPIEVSTDASADGTPARALRSWKAFNTFRHMQWPRAWTPPRSPSASGSR